jgi:ParB-like chromosome segregation protein Spo0J
MTNTTKNERGVAALADIDPAPYNPREIDDEALNALDASVARFGVVQDLVVNKRTTKRGWPKGARPVVVGGHQRMKVLKRQGVTSAPVVWVDLDENDEKALNVVLNSPLSQGAFTDDLRVLLRELKAQPDVESMFDELRLDDLLASVDQNFEPATLDDQSKLDTKITATISCPHCGKEIER